ncbi:hypothetical protein BU17DRAFT_15569, partial [Hysterangium stoloniferum]
LEKTLCNLLALFNQVYIILDALDECSGYLRVLKWLKELLVQSGLKLHILVTTRPQESIRRELDIMGSEYLSLHEQHANDDIAFYIQTTLKTQTSFSSMDQSLHQNIFRTLNDLAEGMFRWVALQLEELSTCYSDGDLEGQLGRLPATLDETYSRIIEKIPKRLQEDALKFLEWLAFSFEPLTSRELVQIIGINMDYKIGGTTSPFNSRNVYRDPNDIVSVCSGLVLHSGGEYYKIKLAHFSVKEYLMDSSIGGRPSSFHLEKQLSHSHITKMCLIYL